MDTCHMEHIILYIKGWLYNGSWMTSHTFCFFLPPFPLLRTYALCICVTKRLTLTLFGDVINGCFLTSGSSISEFSRSFLIQNLRHWMCCWVAIRARIYRQIAGENGDIKVLISKAFQDFRPYLDTSGMTRMQLARIGRAMLTAIRRRNWTGSDWISIFLLVSMILP